MGDSKVRKWCRNFDAGRTQIFHTAGSQGRSQYPTVLFQARRIDGLEIVSSEFEEFSIPRRRWSFETKIVTGDETCVHYETGKAKKEQSRAVDAFTLPESSASEVQKAHVLPPKKNVAQCFGTVKVFSWWESCPHWHSISLQLRSQGCFKRLRKTKVEQRRGMLSSGIVLLHDNAGPHTAVAAAILCSVLDGKF
ncbi:hypothetical protein AVEN_121845-1 [Araneus ventricosus]|uniref:Histone-lysine N-methyltransferase SETMAR n=1 Tax=Araneus ventricosus TaxID=182803 RepID=A0A4Y2VR49_ARAVE|nr:hypothetical protein AVEN_121845-1 [Araneus ventricosus]